MGLLDDLPGEENCGTCRFWQLRYAEEQIGMCRRHAPGTDELRPWPLTNAESYCGDWEQAIQGLDG